MPVPTAAQDPDGYQICERSHDWQELADEIASLLGADEWSGDGREGLQGCRDSRERPPSPPSSWIFRG